MHTRSALMTSLLVGVLLFPAAASAADTPDTNKDAATAHESQRAMPDRDRQDSGMRGGMMGNGGMMGSGRMMGGGGMMGGGMGGMMDMMSGCSQMKGTGATPHLPPGNDKLQLKMQAEIMQKTAEILSRYADQIGETK